MISCSPKGHFVSGWRNKPEGSLTRDHENLRRRQMLRILKPILRLVALGILPGHGKGSASSFGLSPCARHEMPLRATRNHTKAPHVTVAAHCQSAFLSLNRAWEGNEQPTFRVFSCSVTTLFVSDDAAKPEGLLRRDGMGRVEDSRPNGVELRQIAVRRLVASAAFVVARQRSTFARQRK